MNTSNADNPDANRHDPDHQKWLDDRIEAYLDGELPAEESRRFEQLLEQDDLSQQSLSWAISIRDELRAIPAPDCSPDLQTAIMNEVRKDAWEARKSRFSSGLGAFLQGLFPQQWRPALATLTLLVIASVLVFFINRTTPWQSTHGEISQQVSQEDISQAEVEQALEEAKWALGYVSKTGRLTGTSMQDALAPLMKEHTKD